jgi:hypothetical protein
METLERSVLTTLFPMYMYKKEPKHWPSLNASIAWPNQTKFLFLAGGH